MGVIGVLSVVADFLHGNESGRPIYSDDLAPVLEDIRNSLAIVDDVFTAADSAARSAVTAATDAATQLDVIGNDVKYITEHTYKVVIPRSMSYLLGYVVSHYIGPIESHLTKLDHDIAFLMGWRSQIDVWRHKYVDPHIHDYELWRKWFDGWPQGVLYKWHDWFAHPADFGAWAAEPIAAPLVARLSQRQDKATRDKLAALMVKSWSEIPDEAWRDVQEWLLAGR